MYRHLYRPRPSGARSMAAVRRAPTARDLPYPKQMKIGFFVVELLGISASPPPRVRGSVFGRLRCGKIPHPRGRGVKGGISGLFSLTAQYRGNRVAGCGSNGRGAIAPIMRGGRLLSALSPRAPASNCTRCPPDHYKKSPKAGQDER